MGFRCRVCGFSSDFEFLFMRKEYPPVCRRCWDSSRARHPQVRDRCRICGWEGPSEYCFHVHHHPLDGRCVDLIRMCSHCHSILTQMGERIWSRWLEIQRAAPIDMPRAAEKLAEMPRDQIIGFALQHPDMAKVESEWLRRLICEYWGFHAVNKAFRYARGLAPFGFQLGEDLEGRMKRALDSLFAKIILGTE